MNRNISRLWIAAIAAVFFSIGATVANAAMDSGGTPPPPPPPPSAPASSLGQLTGSSAQTTIQGTVLQFQMLSQQLRNIGTGGGGGVAAFELPAPAGGMLAPHDHTQFAGLGDDHQAVVRGQCSGPGHGSWFTGYGIGGDVKGTAIADGLDYESSGGQFGFYRLSDAGTAFGGFAGYANQGVDLITESSTSDINSGQLGLFLRHGNACNYFLLAGAVAYDSYDTARSTATGTAVGDFDGLQGSAYVERGWFVRRGGIVLEPSVALQYTWLRQNDYVETGAGANNLTFSASDTDSLRSMVGIRFKRPICTPIGQFVPELRGHWMHEFLDTTTSVIIAAAGPPGTSTGIDLGREWAMVGGGFTLEIGPAVSLFANYDLQLNERSAFHVASGGARWEW